MAQEIHGYELNLSAYGVTQSQLIGILVDALNALEWGVLTTRRENLSMAVSPLSQLELEHVRQRFNQMARVKT